jgi:hypothetical protein
MRGCKLAPGLEGAVIALRTSGSITSLLNRKQCSEFGRITTYSGRHGESEYPLDTIPADGSEAQIVDSKIVKIWGKVRQDRCTGDVGVGNCSWTQRNS